MAAARILPRKNPGEDVCRGQSSLTFSGTIPNGQKLCPPCLGACDRHRSIVYVSHAKHLATWELTVSSPIRTGFRSAVGLCRGSAMSAMGQ